MAALHRVIALYLLLVGLAVGAYFVISPLYAGQGNLADASDVWDILNWFMAVAAILLVLVTYRRDEVAGRRCQLAGTSLSPTDASTLPWPSSSAS